MGAVGVDQHSVFVLHVVAIAADVVPAVDDQAILPQPGGDLLCGGQSGQPGSHD